MATTEDLNGAEIKKLVAETHEIEAHTKQAASRMALRDKALRLAVERAEIELDTQRRYNESGKLDHAKKVRDEALLAASDPLIHVYDFVGGVDATSVSACMLRLSQWDHADPTCDMTIRFNSPGGGVINGMALFDAIRFQIDKGHKVTCIGLGYAASMGGILLQAASPGRRLMARNSWLLIHEVAFNTGGSIGAVEDMYEFAKMMKAQAAEIFIGRSGGKLTQKVLDENWTRKDWWMSPVTALSLGLIDEIV